MILDRPIGALRPQPTHPVPAGAAALRDRLLWPDVAKGACIVLVVLWHVIWKHYQQVHWHVAAPVPRGWALLNDQLTPMRMPLFFTISGMFAVGVIGRSWRTLLRARLLRFLVLYVLWVLIETAVLRLTPDFRTAHAADPVQLAAELTVSPTNLWYLLALGLYFPLAKACRRVPTVWVLAATSALAVAAASHLIPNAGNRWQVLQNLVFFLAGSRLASRLHGLAARPVHARHALLIAGAGAASGLLAALHAQAWPGAQTAVSAAAAVSGICTAAAVARRFPRVARPVAALGRRTLPVYVLHLPILAVLDGLVRPSLQRFGAGSTLIAVVEPALVTALVVALSLAVHRLLLSAGLRRLFDPFTDSPLRADGRRTPRTSAAHRGLVGRASKKLRSKEYCVPRNTVRGMQHDGAAEVPDGSEAEGRSTAAAHGLLALRPPGFVRADGPPREWSSTAGADAPTDADRDRLRRLAIPPAWRDVWAASSPTAPLQATGVDARGRTQYRYSAEATSTAAAVKFAEMERFAATLPALHRRVATDLALPAAGVRPILAALVRLLERGLLRVGDERYARDDHTYGLTTLRARQVEVEGPVVRMDFVGKEHIRHRVEVEDAPVARVVAGLLASAPEADASLFGSRGARHPVTSATVNAYLHAHTGAAASAKVFRTWGATAIAASVLAGARPVGADAGSLRNRAIRAAATALGDTPAVTRASYLHPQWERAGGSPDVARAVAAAAARAGTDAATAVSHDERLQAAILRALSAG